MARLVLLQTGPADAEVSSGHGDYGHQFASALNLPDLWVHDATGPDPVPRGPTPHGVIITGSAAMVTDRAPWSERLAGWLREAVPAGVPVFGVCYGHQLLAHALGGRVDWNPGGPHLGADAVDWSDAAALDPVFTELPSLQFYDHAQQVLELPTGGVTLGNAAGVPHAAFRVGSNAWGVQFHPEWSPAIFRDVLRAGEEVLAARGADPETEPLPAEWPGRGALLAFRAWVERRAAHASPLKPLGGPGDAG